jgi:hypothetical protein
VEPQFDLPKHSETARWSVLSSQPIAQEQPSMLESQRRLDETNDGRELVQAKRAFWRGIEVALAPLESCASARSFGESNGR